MVDRENVFPHNAHRKGRSPVWTRQWSFMWCRSLNAFPQNSHLKGLSPVCIGRWAISELTSGNDLPQNLHKTTPAPPSVASSMSIAVGGWSVGSGGSWGTAGPLPLKCDSIRFSGSDKPRVWCCSCSRYFNVSRLCDSMCRVNLLWWGKEAPQYMQVYNRGDTESLQSSSCNRTNKTSTSCRVLV